MALTASCAGTVSKTVQQELAEAMLVLCEANWATLQGDCQSATALGKGTDLSEAALASLQQHGRQCTTFLLRRALTLAISAAPVLRVNASRFCINQI